MTNTKPTWDWENNKSLMEEFNKILEGVDKTEVEYKEGWWETSTGAAFGHGRKILLRSFIQKVYDEAYERGKNEGLPKLDCMKCKKDFKENKEWLMLLMHKKC